jgi:hypothetical protein
MVSLDTTFSAAEKMLLKTPEIASKFSENEMKICRIPRLPVISKGKV